MNKLANFAFTAALALASLFLVSCGEHTFDDFLEDIFGSSSSAEEEELLSSSSAGRSSSSSAARSGSSSSAGGGSGLDLSRGGAGTLEIQDEKNGQFITSDGKTIKVYYTVPPSVNDETKVIIILGGTDRNVAFIVNPLSRASADAVVIGLSFDRDDFLNSQYDFANMYNSGVTPYSEWSFHYIDAAFEQFAAHYGLSAKKYVLFGWSAGSSLATRTYMFSVSPYLDYVITGGMSSPVYLDEARNHQNGYSLRSGIKEFLQYKDVIFDNLANRKLYILIGRDDIRYERAIDFYEYDKIYAREHNINLDWELTAIEGADHHGARTVPFIANILATGTASSGKLPPSGGIDLSYVSPFSDKGKSIAAYETVAINGKKWMAENLNYAAPGSRCYGEGASAFTAEDVQANCDKFGRLYDWETAKTVCPSGWHLPSDDEWSAFTSYIDGGNASPNGSSPTAGKNLKAKDIWNSCNSSSCMDSHGFAAFPGGLGYDSGNRFSVINEVGNWWSATERDAGSAYYRSMVYRNQDAFRYYNDKSYLFSVRCAEN